MCSLSIEYLQWSGTQRIRPDSEMALFVRSATISSDGRSLQTLSVQPLLLTPLGSVCKSSRWAVCVCVSGMCVCIHLHVGGWYRVHIHDYSLCLSLPRTSSSPFSSAKLSRSRIALYGCMRLLYVIVFVYMYACASYTL